MRAPRTGLDRPARRVPSGATEHQVLPKRSGATERLVAGERRFLPTASVDANNRSVLRLAPGWPELGWPLSYREGLTAALRPTKR